MSDQLKNFIKECILEAKGGKKKDSDKDLKDSRNIKKEKDYSKGNDKYDLKSVWRPLTVKLNSYTEDRLQEAKDYCIEQIEESAINPTSKAGIIANIKGCKTLARLVDYAWMSLLQYEVGKSIK